jgi:hypothetical protein
VRDVKKDYRDAMVAEYASLVRAGRAEEAEHVAESLREQFDYDVSPKRGRAKKEEPEQTRETTAAAPAPENTAEPKAPAPRAPRVQSAKRTAQGDSGK